MNFGYIKGSETLNEDPNIYSMPFSNTPIGNASWAIILHPVNSYNGLYFILVKNMRLSDDEEATNTKMVYDQCARISMSSPTYIECEIPNWRLNNDEKKLLTKILSSNNMWNYIIKSWNRELGTHTTLFPKPDYMQLP